jgi:predicted dienelactone hydrolase
MRTYPGATSYADPRVKAVLAMSPFGPGPLRGLNAESWQELRVPALFMIGSDETGVSDAETVEWRKQAYGLAPAGDKWLVMIEGARSSTFTGIYQTPPPAAPRVSDRDAAGNVMSPNTANVQGREGYSGLRERGLFNRIQGVSLSFWDTYLRGDAEGRTALERAATEKK